MLLELVRDCRDIGLDLTVLRLHSRKAVVRLLKEPEQTFLFFIVNVKIAQLRYQLCHHLPGFPHIFRTHIVERGLGEIRQLLLRGGTVVHNGGGIGQVDFVRESIHLRKLFRRQQFSGFFHRVFRGFGRCRLRGFFRRSGGCFLRPGEGQYRRLRSLFVKIPEKIICHLFSPSCGTSPSRSIMVFITEISDWMSHALFWNRSLNSFS